MHRRQAPVGVCHRTAGAALCGSLSATDPSPQSAPARHSMTWAQRLLTAVLAVGLLILAGCSSTGGSGGGKGGGYYKDDGPGSNIPADIEAIPNAVPRIEAHAKANFRPYVVFGKRYVPVSDERPFRQTGQASWYGKKFHGRKTANGETYDMYAMTAAHPTLPLPSYAKVTRPQTGQSVIVHINDRGPFHSNRIIDLSYVAAAKLGLITPGSGTVIVEAITHDDIRAGRYTDESTSMGNTPADLDLFLASLPPPSIEPSLGLNSHPPADIHTYLSLINHSSSVPQIFLQFGAYSNAQSATELASQINQDIGELDYHDAHIDPAGNLFRVQMGPYTSRAEALTAAQVIESETGHKPHLAVR